jgi:hypothetical protein
MEVSGQSHVTAAVRTSYTLDKRLDVSQSWPGCSSEEEDSSPETENKLKNTGRKLHVFVSVKLHISGT